MEWLKNLFLVYYQIQKQRCTPKEHFRVARLNKKPNSLHYSAVQRIPKFMTHTHTRTTYTRIGLEKLRPGFEKMDDAKELTCVIGRLRTCSQGSRPTTEQEQRHYDVRDSLSL